MFPPTDLEFFWYELWRAICRRHLLSHSLPPSPSNFRLPYNTGIYGFDEGGGQLCKSFEGGGGQVCQGGGLQKWGGQLSQWGHQATVTTGDAASGHGITRGAVAAFDKEEKGETCNAFLCAMCNAVGKTRCTLHINPLHKIVPKQIISCHVK